MTLTTTKPPARVGAGTFHHAIQSALGDPTGPWPWIFRLVAVATLFGCQAIHTTVVQPHLLEWLPAGFFFLGLTLVEGSLGVVLLLSPSRRLCWVAIAVTGATLALWAVSRGAGLPFGPEALQPESIGRPDIIATLLEVVRLGALLGLVACPQPASFWSSRSPSRPVRLLLGVVVVLAVAAVATVGVKAASKHSHGTGRASGAVSIHLTVVT